tara:strand:+ start:838 stop:1344 length:507 start_codon:yes stop_codon:yes gene_type:complete
VIQKLDNPLTSDYIDLKNFILSIDFPWFRLPNTTLNIKDDGISFFTHTFLERPEANIGYSRSNSPYIDGCLKVLHQIVSYNDVEFNYFIRASVNLVSPCSTVKRTVEHCDHQFPHKNILIYLSETDGDTVVDGENFSPQEDCGIIFTGKHYHYTPTDKDRIVLVGTFI